MLHVCVCMQICGLIAPVLVQELDRLHATVADRDQQLELECRRTQRHSSDARLNRQDYQRALTLAQVLFAGRGSTRARQSQFHGQKRCQLLPKTLKI